MYTVALSLAAIATGAYLDVSPRVRLPWPVNRILPMVLYGAGAGALIAHAFRTLRHL